MSKVTKGIHTYMRACIQASDILSDESFSSIPSGAAPSHYLPQQCFTVFPYVELCLCTIFMPQDQHVLSTYSSSHGLPFCSLLWWLYPCIQRYMYIYVVSLEYHFIATWGYFFQHFLEIFMYLEGCWRIIFLYPMSEYVLGTSTQQGYFRKKNEIS